MPNRELTVRSTRSKVLANTSTTKNTAVGQDDDTYASVGGQTKQLVTDQTTHEFLELLLIEQKITNLYLSDLTGSHFTAEDVS